MTRAPGRSDRAGAADLPAAARVTARQVDLAARVLYLLRFMASTGVVDPAQRAGQSRMPASRGLSALFLLLLCGCGGSSPLLHPAHALPLNTVSFGTGVSGQFVSDDAEATVDRGRAAATGPLSDPVTAQAYSKGVLTQALLGPGISPWVSARVGLPWTSEAGLTYTGRSIRLDGRHVLAIGDVWALSLGLGGTALLLSPDSSAPSGTDSGAANAEAEFELNATGWGADVPVVFGYEAVDGFVDVWAGARGGFERVAGELRTRSLDPSSPRMDAEGHRWWAGALAGFSLGVPPLWLRFELATTFHQLSGELAPTGPESEGQAAPEFGPIDASGWSLSPSGAILGKF